jgi:hypothetical protein
VGKDRPASNKRFPGAGLRLMGALIYGILSVVTQLTEIKVGRAFYVSAKYTAIRRNNDRTRCLSGDLERFAAGPYRIWQRVEAQGLKYGAGWPRLITKIQELKHDQEERH